MSDKPIRCKHCGCRIKAAPYGAHLEGSQTGKNRCGEESGLPYGYDGEAIGAPCTIACIGGVRPDDREGYHPIRTFPRQAAAGA